MSAQATASREVKEEQETLVNRLTQVYANFTLGACVRDTTTVNVQPEGGLIKPSKTNSKMSDLAYKKLKQVLARVAGLDLILVKAIQSQHAADEENVCNRLLFAGFLLRYLAERNKTTDLAQQLKTYVVKIYMDHLIGNRVKQRAPLVKCANYWLSQCSRDEFERLVLPDIKRSLLRSPELVLESEHDTTNKNPDFQTPTNKFFACKVLRFFWTA